MQKNEGQVLLFKNCISILGVTLVMLRSNDINTRIFRIFKILDERKGNKKEF